MPTDTVTPAVPPRHPRGRPEAPAGGPVAEGAPAPRSTVLGVALLALGLGAALVALLGPLVLGVFDYHVSSGASGQIRGGDVAALLLVAPVSIAAGVLVLQGRVLGAALALGPATFGLYMYFQLATGGDPHRYPGNVEVFFPVLLALFLLAGYVAWQAWRTLLPVTLPSAGRGVDRLSGGFLLVVATFLVLGLHLPGLMTLWRGEPTEEYLADPGVFWVVKVMDLGLVVPALVLVGLALLRHHPERVGAARYAVTGLGALLGSSVAGMAVVMQATDAPGSSPALTVAFCTFAVVALVVAALQLRPLVQADRHR
jgi:hypothetical protein